MATRLSQYGYSEEFSDLLSYRVAISKNANYLCLMTTSPAAGATTTDAEIGNRIIREAAAKGVSIDAISKATPLSYPTLLKSLTGERSFKIRELGAIANALGVTTATLVEEALSQEELTEARAA